MVINQKLRKIDDLNFEFNSNAEKFTAEVLIQLVNNKAIYNLIYNKPVKINDRTRYIDFSFMCNGIEIWLEYNGAQHYVLSKHNDFDESKLLSQKQRDKQLRKFASGQKIPFIVYGCEKNGKEYASHFNNMNITYPNILKAVHKAVEGKFKYMFNNKKKN